jgi:hypothetical protein
MNFGRGADRGAGADFTPCRPRAPRRRHGGGNARLAQGAGGRRYMTAEAPLPGANPGNQLQEGQVNDHGH